MHATATATVSVSAERIWAVLSDHEGMTRWAPGMKASLIRTGDSERNGVGAVRRLQPLPLLPGFVEAVTAFEPDRRLTYRAVSGVPLRNYVGDVVLYPHGDRTEIRYSVSADNQIPVVGPLLANVLLFAFKRQVKRTA